MTVYNSNTDDRMFWIRELVRRKNLTTVNDRSRYFEEHELVSECDIHRRLWYEDGLIACWHVGQNSYLPRLHTYALKLDLPTAADFPRTANDEPILIASEEGYFSRSLEDELISLLSLWLHTRFFWVHCTTGESSYTSVSSRAGREFTYHPCKNSHQRKSSLFKSKEKDMYSLSVILDATRELPSRIHRHFYLAASHYAEAIRWIGFDDEIAYIRLVAAVEVLAAFEEIEGDGLPEKFNRMLEENSVGFTDLQKGELKSYLKHRKVRFKFVQFLLRHGESYFHGRPTTPKNCWVTFDSLEKYATGIYQGRSRFLHRGEPLWISWEMIRKDVDERGFDLDISLGRTHDQHKWSESEKLPTVLFFEELVRHCLLNFLGVFPLKRF